jgi:hypothetical protein
MEAFPACPFSKVPKCLEDHPDPEAHCLAYTSCACGTGRPLHTTNQVAIAPTGTRWQRSTACSLMVSWWCRRGTATPIPTDAEAHDRVALTGAQLPCIVQLQASP